MVNHSRASKPAPQTPKSMDAGLRRRLEQQGRHGLLDLSDLDLTTLPWDILPQGSQPIVALLLGYNRLSSLPPDFATKFPSLVWLDLSNNNFRPGGIPKSIANLESLQLVDLEGNPEIEKLPAVFAGSQTTVLVGSSRTDEDDEDGETLEESAEEEASEADDDFDDHEFNPSAQYEWEHHDSDNSESYDEDEPDSLSDGDIDTNSVSGRTSPLSTPRTESKRTARLRRKGKLLRLEAENGTDVLSESGHDRVEVPSLSVLSASPLKREARTFFHHLLRQNHLTDSAENGFRQLVADHDEDFDWYLMHRYKQWAARRRHMSAVKAASVTVTMKTKKIQRLYDHKDKERSLKVGIGRDRGRKYAATHTGED